MIETAPAPDLPTLFRHEDALERGFRAFLVANGLPAVRGREVLLAPSDPEDADAPPEVALLRTPRVEIRLLPGGATGHRVRLPDGRRLEDAWKGQMLLSVITSRTRLIQARREDADAPDPHPELVGRVRALLVDADVGGRGIPPRDLPWHHVEMFEDAGSAPAVDADADLDFSPLLYSVRWVVRPGAWPRGSRATLTPPVPDFALPER